MDRGETTFFTNSETPIPTDLEKVKKIKNLKTIYVPKSSIIKYKTTEGWSEYKDIILCLEEFKKEWRKGQFSCGGKGVSP